MHPYIGSGPYCYANSLAMALGPTAPSPSTIEVLTGSPFGMHLLGGRLPLFDPYGWDDRGIDDAIALLGWTCRRQGADDGEQALALLHEAVKTGPVLAGPLEMGLLRHVPGMTGPIGADHFVTVLEADDTQVLFHDPYGCPYATLPTQDFLAAWRADTITFYHAEPYTMRGNFRQARAVTSEAALRAALPGAVAWLRGRDDLAVPPGTIGGATAVHHLADLVTDGLDPETHDHLTQFAIRVGARRLADAATALTSIGRDGAATIATRQARLVGSLQHDLVNGHTDSATQTLQQLAPTYDQLAAALS
ncbi:hypothetical protein [Paractinoplanes durhamensis]|uniref:Uncharacterized protein n=1 Tax=Paractinoplanes durhamensis TaxID=113563 RepID=A0ABQ3YS40_9ACTN|nr:hypothetical protein [Actinoplanes durhamensis]GIE00194.1 hypothetical protein Adu01nite_15440 [Actinoplanes durhamensis]